MMKLNNYSVYYSYVHLYVIVNCNNLTIINAITSRSNGRKFSCYTIAAANRFQKPKVGIHLPQKIHTHVEHRETSMFEFVRQFYDKAKTEWPLQQST